MRVSKLCVLAVWSWLAAASCDVYDSRLIELRDAALDVRDGAADDAGGSSDAGLGCVPIEEGYPCAESCPETCNGSDDDCDGRIDEVDQRSSCQLPHALSVCAGSECLIAACKPGFVDCNAELEDGCEATLDTLEHCGVCGHTCQVPNAEVECDDGECVMLGCRPDYEDCDAKESTGCERALTTLTDCGTCGNSCTTANAVTRCREGGCEFVECQSGWGDCNDDAARLGQGDGCETQLDTPQHCGGCGVTCQGGTPYCSGGQCSALQCGTDTADCDGDNIECETNLRSVTNCGGCGVVCGPFGNATNGCGSGQCVMTCNVGYDDCDDSRSTGCETNIRTTLNCGRCGSTCSYANATASCTDGTCALTSCTSGYADCNMDLALDGCEERLNTNAHCGQCGRACSLANASASCSSGTCQVASCNANFGNCDGQADTGCEANLDSSNQHCGNCNFACPYNQTCAAGRCMCSTDANCASGQTCCGGSCVDLDDDEANCGGCGIVCAAGQTCCSRTCRNLSTDFDNCGSCGNRCDSNSNRCTSGACRCTNDSPCSTFYRCCADGCDFGFC